MGTMKRFRLFWAAALVLLTAGACQQEEITGEENSRLTEQETLTEEILVDLDALVDEALLQQMSLLKSATAEGNYFLNSCPVVTYDQTAEPQKMTIDFGAGCTGKDWKVRSGKIIVTATSFENATSERVKTFDNFYVEGKKVEGTIRKAITIDREDRSRVAEIEEEVTITFPNGGGTAHRVARLTREYQLNLAGIKKDNQIISWGTTEFTRTNGIKVTKTVQKETPLVFKMACHRIVSGIVIFTTSDNRTWSVDYGNGECDNLATVTNGNKTRTIRLK